MELAVGEPVLQKSGLNEYHTYRVFGRDSLGDIECNRRFNNFFELRKVMCVRYPGLYIPPIPNKKTGAKDEEVIRERQYFLDLFLKECC
jgi:sorting nexin-1/2